MTLSAKSRPDMRWLAVRLAATHDKDRPALAAAMMANGMMYCQWWLMLGARFLRWRHGLNKHEAWAWIFHRFPGGVDDLIMGAARHIQFGKDADGEGVGGFNQREVDEMVRLLGVTA